MAFPTVQLLVSILQNHKKFVLKIFKFCDAVLQVITVPEHSSTKKVTNFQSAKVEKLCFLSDWVLYK